jgi:hypothetical protein
MYQKKLADLAKLALGSLSLVPSGGLQTHIGMIAGDMNSGPHVYKASILTQGALYPVTDEIFMQYKNNAVI